jgi:hypothetical protein
MMSGAVSGRLLAGTFRLGAHLATRPVAALIMRDLLAQHDRALIHPAAASRFARRGR